MLELAVDLRLLERLKSRFPQLDQRTVERCLREVCACAEHLDVHVTETIVESLTEERLTAVQAGRRTSGTG